MNIMWRVFSTSPFEQAVVFVDDTTPAVNSVSVSPSEGTILQGSSLQFTADVDTTGFANKAVKWNVVDSTTEQPVEGVTINESGLLKVASSVSNGLEFLVTATSVFDEGTGATATISTPSA